MRLATLISWLLTASLGAHMLRTWLARGGLRRERARPGGLPPQLIFGHAGLAISGLFVWVCYIPDPVAITDEMIAQLFEEPFTSGRRRPFNLNPAVLVPIAHGFAAIGTFVLAVMTASM